MARERLANNFNQGVFMENLFRRIRKKAALAFLWTQLNLEGRSSFAIGVSTRAGGGVGHIRAYAQNVEWK